jgi:hypothetical protein
VYLRHEHFGGFSFAANELWTQEKLITDRKKSVRNEEWEFSYMSW